MNRVDISVQTGTRESSNVSDGLAGTILEAFPGELPAIAETTVLFVLAEKAEQQADVSVVLCDDVCIAELNLSYRSKEGPTDVLSFEQGEVYPDEDGGERCLLGDIVISLPSVLANSERFGVGFLEEFRRVVIHGILHLLGHDHKTNDASEPMLVEQEALLGRLFGAAGVLEDTNHES